MKKLHCRGTVTAYYLSVVALFFAIRAEGQTSKCENSTVDDFAPDLGPSARAFLADLQTTVKAVDKRKLATMIRYPLRVSRDGKTRLVRNQSEFLREYSALFNSGMRNAIANQVPDCLFANWQGMLIGHHGEVWFNQDRQGKMAIKALNIPGEPTAK